MQAPASDCECSAGNASSYAPACTLSICLASKVASGECPSREPWPFQFPLYVGRVQTNACSICIQRHRLRDGTQPFLASCVLAIDHVGLGKSFALARWEPPPLFPYLFLCRSSRPFARVEISRIDLVWKHEMQSVFTGGIQFAMFVAHAHFCSYVGTPISKTGTLRFKEGLFLGEGRG